MAKVVCEKCGTEYKFEVAKNMKNCLVCGASMMDGGDSSSHEASPDKKDEQAGWITWYYYGFKNSSSAVLNDKPIDIEKRGDVYYLIKEFKAPPKDGNGNCDAAKRELRKYVPDAFAETKAVPKVQCPYCHSTEVQLVPKKFSLLTGFLTNGYNRICVRCQRKF